MSTGVNGRRQLRGNLGELETQWPDESDRHCGLIYLTSHHGLAKSGAPALVHALQPRVAVMNNGTRKGAEPDALRVLYDSPGLEDLWQLHWSYNMGLDNRPAMFIANVDDNATIANVLAGAPAQQAPRGGGTLACVLDQGFRPAGRDIHSHEHTQRIQQDI